MELACFLTIISLCCFFVGVCVGGTCTSLGNAKQPVQHPSPWVILEKLLVMVGTAGELQYYLKGSKLPIQDKWWSLQWEMDGVKQILKSTGCCAENSFTGCSVLLEKLILLKARKRSNRDRSSAFSAPNC